VEQVVSILGGGARKRARENQQKYLADIATSEARSADDRPRV